MISVLKAGTVDIIAKAGSITGKAPLTITESQDNEWEAGNQRYNNGTVLQRPAPGTHPDGGGGGGGGFKDKQLSCTNCHGAGADKGSGDIEHTPRRPRATATSSSSRSSPRARSPPAFRSA